MIIQAIKLLSPGHLSEDRAIALAVVRDAASLAVYSKDLSPMQKQKVQALILPEIALVHGSREITPMDIERLRLYARLSLLDNLEIAPPEPLRSTRPLR